MTSIAGIFENFLWSAPDGIKQNGMEMDAQGADIEEINPYIKGEEAAAPYPLFDDSTNHARRAMTICQSPVHGANQLRDKINSLEWRDKRRSDRLL
jgi:hypothetical protein